MSKNAKSGKAPKAAGPSDEMKAKFREALERKQAHAGRESAGEGEGKVHDAHGPAAAQAHVPAQVWRLGQPLDARERPGP